MKAFIETCAVELRIDLKWDLIRPIDKKFATKNEYYNKTSDSNMDAGIGCTKYELVFKFNRKSVCERCISLVI